MAGFHALALFPVDLVHRSFLEFLRARNVGCSARHLDIVEFGNVVSLE